MTIGGGSKYVNPNGSLKPGYSYSADSGGRKVGKYTTIGRNVGRPSIGTNKRIGGTSRDIYKLPSPAAPAPAPARAPKPKPKPKPKAKEEPKAPIEYSPEIQQAKERVQSYEADILSGKTSDDIYSYDNDYSKDTYIAEPSGANIDYSFDASQGSAGIGTPTGDDSSQQARRAATSFLDLKKSELKSKYNL